MAQLMGQDLYLSQAKWQRQCSEALQTTESPSLFIIVYSIYHPTHKALMLPQATRPRATLTHEYWDLSEFFGGEYVYWMLEFIPCKRNVRKDNSLLLGYLFLQFPEKTDRSGQLGGGTGVE